MHIPPIGSVKATEPFMKPTKQPDLSGTDHSASHRQVTGKSPRDHQQDRSTHSELSGTDHPAPHRQSSSKLTKDLPQKSTDLSGTDSIASEHQVTDKSSTTLARSESISSMDTDSKSDFPTNHQWIFCGGR